MKRSNAEMLQAGPPFGSLTLAHSQVTCAREGYGLSCQEGSGTGSGTGLTVKSLLSSLLSVLWRPARRRLSESQ